MHQYRTIAQTLLVLSILNHVTAAPATPQEVRDAGSNVAAVPEDVPTVSERRRGVLSPDVTTGTTPSQFTPSLLDGSPPQDPLPLDKSASLQGSQSSSDGAPSSATDGQLMRTPTSTHPLSAAVGPGPGPDSTAEASTSAYPLSEGSGSAPVPGSNTAASASSHQLVPVHGPASTTSHYTAITPEMLHKDPNVRPLSHKIAGFGFLGAAVATIVLLSVLQKNHNSTGG